ncbi:MAG: Amuc_1100 family pilus-like protein [Luteolibacter sp.]|uniref:Amuc_1100 family pilus-like protein n=1 Tax=Luteolibacter sp. TaxID=1962973 RepID=UPI003266A88B
MSWIKENKFLAALGGGTLLGVIVLYIVGSQGASRYSTAKDEFTAASDAASGYEKGPLYPKPENRDAKRKAITDYRGAVEALQTAFQQFRPAEITNVSPQEFTNRLLAANTETRAAFEENEVIVPEAYFAGFEKYKTSLASESSTGILDYQLASVKNLMLALAKAHPTELKNLYRPELPEEAAKTYAAGDAVARAFPLEITFKGTEKSVREFITAITKPDKQYVVIRSIRVANEKKDPPRAADAQFEKPAAAPSAAAAGGFSGDFVLPGDEPAAPKPAVVTPAADTAPKAADSGRILAQVLGNEEIQVFLRLDVLQFLPAKKLP